LISAKSEHFVTRSERQFDTVLKNLSESTCLTGEIQTNKHKLTNAPSFSGTDRLLGGELATGAGAALDAGSGKMVAMGFESDVTCLIPVGTASAALVPTIAIIGTAVSDMLDWMPVRVSTWGSIG